MNNIDHLRAILLSLWLGAALFFSVAVAPNVFAVLRGFSLVNANEIAGTIVTRTLAVINVAGFILGLLVLLITIAVKRRFRVLAFVLQFFAAATLVVTTGVGQWVIAARMRALRVAMGTIDLVPLSDPRHIAFTQLHIYSVTLMGVAMIAAIIAILAITLSHRRYR
jgi:hypothetical protein